MLCVDYPRSGPVYVLDPQPADLSNCRFVLMTPLEARSSPFTMDTDSAAQIGVAILLVWGIAFVFRTLRKAINIDSPAND